MIHLNPAHLYYPFASSNTVWVKVDAWLLIHSQCELHSIHPDVI